MPRCRGGGLLVLGCTTGLVNESPVVVPMWVTFTSATEDGSSGSGWHAVGVTAF